MGSRLAPKHRSSCASSPARLALGEPHPLVDRGGRSLEGIAVTRKKPTTSIVRSSAAEYLTFVAATGSQQLAVEMRSEDANIWLSQKMMAALYDVTDPAINQHLKRIFADRELAPDAVIK